MAPHARHHLADDVPVALRRRRARARGPEPSPERRCSARSPTSAGAQGLTTSWSCRGCRTSASTPYGSSRCRRRSTRRGCGREGLPALERGRASTPRARSRPPTRRLDGGQLGRREPLAAPPAGAARRSGRGRGGGRRGAVPELDRVGDEAVAAPERRQRHVVLPAKRARPRRPALELRALASGRDCGRCPGCDPAASRPRSAVRARLVVGDLLDARPRRAPAAPSSQCRTSAARGFAASSVALAARAVREEREAARVDGPAAARSAPTGARRGRRRERHLLAA